MNPSFKKAAAQSLKILLVVALFGLLWKKGLISAESLRTGLSNWESSVPAVALMLFCSVLGMVRWHWLLKLQGIDLPFSRTAQLSLIGAFFNFALPGAVSGDLVKAYYIGKEIPGRRGNAFGSILFDRIVGVSALVLVSATALLSGWERFSGSTLVHGIRILLIAGLTGVIAFYGYLFTLREKHDPLLNLLRGPLEGRKLSGSFLRIYEGIRTYHSTPGSVLQVLGLSSLIHLGVATAAVAFGTSLQESQLHWLPVTVVVPLGLLATAVPVLPGGVGTGHAAFAALFLLIGSAKGADIYNLFLIPQLILCGVGGVVYLRFKGELGLPETLPEA
jgi:uncharacterized protein (TIRG00374 family)